MYLHVLTHSLPTRSSSDLRLFLVRRPLGHMFRHVDEDAAEVIIGCRVNDLTALALGANESGRAQQAQVVANQAYAHVELLREVGHRIDRKSTRLNSSH